MLGSAAQNIIVLCDNVFLFHYGSVEYGAIALVGVFYLVVVSIGYGFSRGGQIIIGRRYGEKDNAGVRKSFHTLFLFECIIALILFFGIQYGAESFFHFFVDSPEYYSKCLEYLYPRSYGIFFSYIGVSFVALYTAIARTKFILYDTAVLMIVNIVLNYVLIFGHWGFEPMGISGAAWASTIAEVVAFVVFVLYLIFDKEAKRLRLISIPSLDFKLVQNVFNISMPLLLQSIFGLGGWFVFFSLIEIHKGGDALAASNLVRNVYLILSIPCWGFSASINTLVSNMIGQRKRMAVLPIIKKTAWMNIVITLIMALPVAIWPNYILFPLFGNDENSIIQLATPTLRLLTAILILFCVGSIFMNGMMALGKTMKALYLQMMATVIYLIYSYVAIVCYNVDIIYAWSSEFIYWGFILLVSYLFVRSNKWHSYSY